MKSSISEKIVSVTGLLIFLSISLSAQTDTVVYRLTVSEKVVNIAGKERTAMMINDRMPGPVLHFKVGDYAVIYVKNNMDVETSVHWHGILLPNFYDGVPYLNTPPVEPGETFKYEFLIKHSGTYWYHSHTGLQEQIGVYGSIVVEPEKKKLDYDKDLVLVFSDWTNEKPMHVLKNLKRRNEWYSIKKKTTTPLAKVIAEGGLGAQLKLWRQRMPGADISDIYYDAFLTNGEKQKEYPDLKPGEKIRVRMINASASTYYWLTFGGDTPLLISADGVDVVPVKKDKLLFAIAESYDFIVTIPDDGKLEIRATAMDGSGKTSVFLGSGKILPAKDVPRPDYVGIMKAMAKMDMKMGAPAMIFRPGKNDGLDKMKKYGMQMSEDMSSSKNADVKTEEPATEKPMPGMNMKEDKENVLTGAGMGPDYNYDFLRSRESTSFSKDKPVRKIMLSLTGNMWRYVWSMNGKPVSEADKIKIKKGEVVRITMRNLTMMNHPMHLHGHFFRVINDNGEYSPLKHTVNVAPMKTITIEFDADETGDWFFHCHVLYHLVAGMARVVSYGTPRDPRLKNYPLSTMIKETDQYFTWGTAYGASNMASVEVTSSNIRNQFNVSAEYGWNKNIESDISYERYLSDYFRIYGGINIENETPDDMSEINTVAQVGIRYLLPYFINLDVSIDHQIRPQIRLSAEYLIFSRFAIFGSYQYRADFGVVNTFGPGVNYEDEQIWNVGADIIISKVFSLSGGYDSRFGGGGGIVVRF